MEKLKFDLEINRWDRDDLRFYFAFKGEELFRAIGVTSLIQKIMPQSPFLTEWIRRKGMESRDIMNIAAEYGTLSHICVKELTETGAFMLDYCDDIVNDYILKSEYVDLIRPYRKDWTRRLPRDILAFNQFCIDYQVEPVATEIMLFSFEKLLAGTADLICWMHIGSGQNGVMLKKDKTPRKVMALLDYKSKLDGNFYLAHEIQLWFYKMILKEMFPDLKIDILGNVSPKDWRSSPTYNFHIWNKDREAMCNAYLAAYRETSKDDEEDLITSIRGNLVFKDDASKYFNVKTVSEFIKEVKK